MYTHEKMKLNKFRNVRIPTNTEYFARYGASDPSLGKYTEEAQPLAQDKVSAIAEGSRLYEEYARQMEQEASSK